MIPGVHGERELVAIEVDGTSRTYAVRTVGAIEYGWVTLAAGAHQVTAIYN
jgi:hypothetical protein